MLGALLLHASGAHARQGVVELPSPPGGQPAPTPTVEPIPLVPDAPQVSAPGLGPTVEPVPTIPVSPVPALSRTESRIIHKPRIGLIVAGGSIFVSAYVLQMVLAFGVALSGIDEDGPPHNSGTAGLLTLIPILGPWLGPREIDEPLGSRWVLAWGAIEAGALAMVIAGIVGHDVVKEPAPRKLSLAPFATPEASGLSLRLRW